MYGFCFFFFTLDVKSIKPMHMDAGYDSKTFVCVIFAVYIYTHEQPFLQDINLIPYYCMLIL